MSKIVFDKISKSFGSQQILNNINLEIESGEFLVLVGPSGCGKSTLLRILAGLEMPTAGDVRINGNSVLALEPKDRDLSMVFQSYALYPHLSVFENLAFGLKLRKNTEDEINKRVQETAEILQITDFLNRKPKDLSGGQRQRVALGRALVRQTSIILFDEPLSNLDANLRNQMRYEIKRIHQHTKSTVVYVTHDQVEATTLGDRIAILNQGKVVQIDKSEVIYSRPANLFVASFIGLPEINILHGHDFGKTGLSLGLRPENISICSPNDPGAFEAEFDVCEYLGANYLVYSTFRGQPLRILTNTPPEKQRGQRFHFKIEPEKSIYFESGSGILAST